MLTVQEIQAMSFEKAVFGGYDMKTVDEFIEQITEDYAALQKENAALKSKMKVLVDKIEEYKSVEDGMRRALVSAQNIAQETIDKAKTEAETILTTTKTEAESQMEHYQTQIAQEQATLSQIRQETAEFISKMTGYFEKQMHTLVGLSTSDLLVDDKIADLQTEPPAVAPVQGPSESFAPVQEEETVRPQESTYTIPEDIRQFMQKMDSGNEGMQIKVMEVTLNDTDAEKNAEDKKHFGTLKFGADYSGER